MKAYLSIALWLSCLFGGLAQTTPQLPTLRIDIPQDQPTPWTSLDFNNNPYNFQFAIVTDRTGGHRPGVFMDGINKLNLLQPEFVMSVGDLIEGYTTDLAELNRQWDEFDGFVKALDMPFFYLPGNHDITNQVMEDLWKKRLGDPNYSFVYGDVLFLCLNSEDQRQGAGNATISDEQFEWAKGVLEQNKDVRWTLVFLHQPIWLQKEQSRWPDVEALLSSRKHTVFTGHQHRYQRAERNNGRYYVLATTGGGSSLRGPALGEFDHVVWVTMTDQGPVIANLELGGIWSEDVVTAKTKEYISKALKKTAIQIEPLFIEDATQNFEGATTKVKLTNDEDVPMTVTFKEGFSWDFVGGMEKAVVEVAPNSVEEVQLSLKTRKPLSPSALRPFRLNATISYAFENTPQLEIPFTFNIKPEQRFQLKVAPSLAKVDGQLNEWGPLRQQLMDTPTPNIGGQFDLFYDDNYLYIVAKVTDSDLQLRENTSPWQQDYIGLLVNADPMAKSAMNSGRGWYKESVYLLQTPEKGEMPSNAFPPGLDKLGLQYKCKATADGYVMEAALPLAYVKQRQGEDWRNIRFNLLVGDLDAEEQESYWLMPDWRGKEMRVGSGMFFRP